MTKPLRNCAKGASAYGVICAFRVLCVRISERRFGNNLDLSRYPFLDPACPGWAFGIGKASRRKS